MSRGICLLGSDKRRARSREEVLSELRRPMEDLIREEQAQLVLSALATPGWKHTATVLLLSGPRCSIASEVTMNLGNWNGTVRGVINSLPFKFSIVFCLSKVEWCGFICLFCFHKEEAS